MTAVELLVSKIASKIDGEYWCNQQNITEYVEEAKQMEDETISQLKERIDDLENQIIEMEERN
jgi:translation initiation factor 2B subunit (eIF-2B alpha/beta/delta family)